MAVTGLGSAAVVDPVASLVAALTRRRQYDVRDYWTGEIGASVNAALAAAAADTYSFGKPGQVIVAPGSYAQTTSIVPVSGVDLIGSGWGKTVFRPQGNVPCIVKAATLGSPITDILYADFEIDGSSQTVGVYTSSLKGVDMQYVTRATFEHLYVHDTYASGLGLDFLTGVRIHDCLVKNAGLGNSGTDPGGNGIGIGTGGSASEDWTVSSCRVTGSARFGIMGETQFNTVFSTGGKILGNHVEGNQHGIVDCGMGGATITGNTSVGNTGAGFAVNAGTYSTPTLGKYGLMVANVSKGNSSHGFFYDASTKQVDAGYRFHDNISVGNAGCGFRVDLGSATTRMVSICGNEVGKNTTGGIYINATGAGGAVDFTIDRNELYSNVAAAGSADAIRINADMTRGSVSGNKVHTAPAVNDHLWCLDLITGKTLTGVEIHQNDFQTGYTSGAVSAAATYSGVNLGFNKGWTVNAGSPEGSVKAEIGTLYRRTDGGATTCLYVKESGTSTTGWVASGLTVDGGTP
jgi:hypothetical protein